MIKSTGARMHGPQLSLSNKKWHLEGNWIAQVCHIYQTIPDGYSFIVLFADCPQTVSQSVYDGWIDLRRL